MCIAHVNIYKPLVQEVLRKTRGFGHIAYWSLFNKQNHKYFTLAEICKWMGCILELPRKLQVREDRGMWNLRACFRHLKHEVLQQFHSAQFLLYKYKTPAKQGSDFFPSLLIWFYHLVCSCFFSMFYFWEDNFALSSTSVTTRLLLHTRILIH